MLLFAMAGLAACSEPDQAQTQKAVDEKIAAMKEAKPMDGAEFLALNADKEGVVVLDSGLQYKILEEGSGAQPSVSDSVTVHYRGTLIDGAEFDSSYARGQPATFPLNRVIAGWTEGLQLMKEGSKHELYIPSDLAYGPSGSGRSIGPNETLIFQVELIAVN